MRTHANIVLVQKIRSYMADLLDAGDYDVRPMTSGSKAQSKAMLVSADRLNARLNHLESEQRALLLEISCNSKIAASQVQIVSVTLVFRSFCYFLIVVVRSLISSHRLIIKPI